MAASRLLVFKFLELALTCSCVALHYHSYNFNVEISMLVTGTFIGYLIILVATALGNLMQGPLNKRIDILYSLFGVALFVASGAVILIHMDRYQDVPDRKAFFNNVVDKLRYNFDEKYSDMNLAKASLAIINGAVFLIDAVLTQRCG